MVPLTKICQFLDCFAPTRLAEDWDNVGLLVGDNDSKVARVMTCLTVTPETAREAIESQANLIVAHHPLPFRPIKKLTTEKTASRMIWELVQAGVAIYSPHTGFDSAANGINQMICQKLGLGEIQPLVAIEGEAPEIGSGRIGKPDSPLTLSNLVAKIKTEFEIQHLQIVGNLTHRVGKIASACGAGGSFLDKAIAAGCDTFITGETNFHTCLEAKAQEISLILLGHYASERFAIEELANLLQQNFADLDVWPAKKESDPVSWV